MSASTSPSGVGLSATAATVTREPALVGLVADMSQLYDRSSKRALAAASQTTPAAAEPKTPESPAPEGQPEED